MEIIVDLCSKKVLEKLTHAVVVNVLRLVACAAQDETLSIPCLQLPLQLEVCVTVSLCAILLHTRVHVLMHFSLFLLKPR